MRTAMWIIGIFVVMLIGMQFHQPKFELVPAPQAAMEAQLHPAAQVRDTLRHSCYNCHSAEVRVPWYGRVWPASVLVQKDIREGRAHLDFSSWSSLSPEMSRTRLLGACKAMRESEMPLWYYRPLHPRSAPREQEVAAFCSWAEALPLQSGLAELQ